MKLWLMRSKDRLGELFFLLAPLSTAAMTSSVALYALLGFAVSPAKHAWRIVHREPLLVLGVLIVAALAASSVPLPLTGWERCLLLEKYHKLLVLPWLVACAYERLSRGAPPWRAMGRAFMFAVLLTALGQLAKWCLVHFDARWPVDGMFHDHITTSLVYAAGIYGLIITPSEHLWGRYRWMSPALLVLLVWLLLFVNQGKSGVVCLVGLCPMAFYWRWGWRSVVISLGLVLLGGLSLWFLPSSFSHMFHQMWQHWHHYQPSRLQYHSTSIRLQLLYDSWHHLLAHPWGAGLGAQRRVLIMPHAHNTLMNLALQLGWVGVVLGLAWFGRLIQIAWQQPQGQRPYAMGLVWMMVVLAQVDSLMLGVTYGYLSLFLMAWYVASYHQVRERGLSKCSSWPLLRP